MEDQKECIYIACGTLTNNGTISMTARGAKAEGQNVYLFKNLDSTYEYVPKEGGSGGKGVATPSSGIARKKWRNSWYRRWWIRCYDCKLSFWKWFNGDFLFWWNWWWTEVLMTHYIYLVQEVFLEEWEVMQQEMVVLVQEILEE